MTYFYTRHLLVYTMIVNTRPTIKHQPTETRLGNNASKKIRIINVMEYPPVLTHHVKSPMLMNTIVKCRR